MTLRCKVDSNPPAAILWRKEGLNGIFSPEEEIVFSPVTKHTAGLYSCTAENQLGMSKPDYVELNVKCKHSSCFRYISMIVGCIIAMAQDCFYKSNYNLPIFNIYNFFYFEDNSTHPCQKIKLINQNIKAVRKK